VEGGVIAIIGCKAGWQVQRRAPAHLCTYAIDQQSILIIVGKPVLGLELLLMDLVLPYGTLIA
jgi:hypothetical protein